MHTHWKKNKAKQDITSPHCLFDFIQRGESECLQPPSQCLQASCCVHVSSTCQYGEVVFMILKCEILAVWDKLDWSGFSVALSEETRQAWLVQLTTLFDNDYLYFKYRWAGGNRRAHNTNRHGIMGTHRSFWSFNFSVHVTRIISCLIYKQFNQIDQKVTM